MGSLLCSARTLWVQVKEHHEITECGPDCSTHLSFVIPQVRLVCSLCDRDYVTILCEEHRDLCCPSCFRDVLSLVKNP
jgi:hypothetical protein